MTHYYTQRQLMERLNLGSKRALYTWINKRGLPIYLRKRNGLVQPHRERDPACAGISLSLL